ncbi:MAG: LytR C-terminal domain-containing protein [Candidatus Kapaibacterium sp.]
MAEPSRRTYPPRLREIQAQEEAEQQAVAERRKRRRLRIIVPILLLLLIPLGYGLLERNVFRPKVDPTVDRRHMRVHADEHIQINVVNACGADGVAKKFSEFLRARKFDVPEYGNAEEVRFQSMVIDRVGDSVSAQKVAYALGIPSERVVTEIDSSLYVRATVVVGSDYTTLRPMQ